MNRRDAILLGVAVVAGGAGVIYYATRSKAGAEIPKEIKVNCACLACRQHVRLVAGLTEPRPYVCPECGERAAYPLLECFKCGKHFVPNLERREGMDLPSMPVVPSCPACGSSQVGAYREQEGVLTSEELLLPSWP